MVQIDLFCHSAVVPGQHCFIFAVLEAATGMQQTGDEA